MNNPISKIILMLANTDLSLDEIYTFVRWIDRYGASRFMHRIERIRKMADEDFSARSFASARPSQPSLSRIESSGIAERVERLLIEEAGLTRIMAAEVLLRELSREFDVSELPEYGKSSFRIWIERISGIIPPSQILHIATKIRNEKVHVRDSEWPLGGKKE